METQLIDRLRKGDRRAFDRIYQLYVRQLMSYTMKYVRVEEDAEEIVEDVFISLWNNRGTIKRSDTLRPLLYIATRHRILNALRKRVNSPIYEDYVETCAKHVAESGSYGIEYEEFELTVLRAIDSLPPTQRRVITMSRLKGMPNAEIAEQLQLSQQTVKNALHVGLRQLRAVLELLHGKHIVTIILFMKVFQG